MATTITNPKHKLFDALLQLKDAGAITADAVTQVASVDAKLDVGAGEVNGFLCIDITAMDATTGDENYKLRLQGSTASDFSAGVVTLVTFEAGDVTTLGPNESADTALAHYAIPFTNEKAGTLYRYLRLHTDVTGTTPSINYKAYLSI